MAVRTLLTIYIAVVVVHNAPYRCQNNRECFTYDHVSRRTIEFNGRGRICQKHHYLNSVIDDFALKKVRKGKPYFLSQS